MMHTNKDILLGHVVHNHNGILYIAEREASSDRHDDQMSGFSICGGWFGMDIKQGSMVSVGLEFVNPNLFDRLIMLVEEDDIVFVGGKNRAHDLAMVLHNGDGFVVVGSVEFELD